VLRPLSPTEPLPRIGALAVRGHFFPFAAKRAVKRAGSQQASRQPASEQAASKLAGSQQERREKREEKRERREEKRGKRPREGGKRERCGAGSNQVLLALLVMWRRANGLISQLPVVATLSRRRKQPAREK
jgi:hypothetical protein